MNRRLKVAILAAAVIAATVSAVSGCATPGEQEVRMRGFRDTGWAFIIVDIQGGLMPFYNQGGVIRAVSNLREKAYETGTPVIYIRHCGSSTRRGTESWRIHRSIKPRDGDILIDKEYPSGFTGTALAEILDELGVGTVVAAGISTCHCYSATVYDALVQGYNVVVAADGHSNHYPNARELIDSYNEQFAGQENAAVLPSAGISFPAVR